MTYTYSDLHFYEWMLHELKKQPNSKPEKVEALIIDMKRQLRANSKRMDDRQIVRDGCDSFVAKGQCGDQGYIDVFIAHFSCGRIDV